MTTGTPTNPAGLNVYGDTMRQSGDANRGADIASQRLDDLDREALRHLKALPENRHAEHPGRPRALDLGCGQGAMTWEMAKEGAAVVGIDLRCPVAETETWIPVPLAGALQWRSVNLIDLARALETAGRPAFPVSEWARDEVAMDVIFSQRTIHYLSHATAGRLLRGLRRTMAGPRTKLFLSASGIGSELADGYPHATRPVTDRHCPLAPAMAEKHHIRAPVTLYDADDLARLVDAAGWRCEDIWVSAFGNIKLIATA